MYKFIQTHFDLNLAKLCLILAGFYNLLFNSIILFNHNFTKGQDILKITLDIIYLTIILFIFFWGLAIHRKLFIVGSILLFLSGALASYYLFSFDLFPNLSNLKSFFNTSSHNIYSAINIKLIAWLIFSIFVCLYTIKHFNILSSNLFFSKLLSAFGLVLMVNAIISPPYKTFTNYFPGAYLHNSYLLIISKNTNK